MASKLLSRILLVVSVAGSILCLNDFEAVDLELWASTKPAIRVLFIGNSYTLANNMPRIVERLYFTDPGNTSKIVASVIAYSGGHLSEHIKDGVLSRISLGEWDYVVLQDCGFCHSHPYTQEAFEQAVAVLAKHIQAAGATPVLFAEWAWKPGSSQYKIPAMLGDYKTQQDSITQNARRIAAQNNMEIVEIGEYWRNSLQRYPEIPLYIRDEYHPTAKGSYLTALVFAAFFAHHPPAQISYKHFLVKQSEAEKFLSLITDTYHHKL